MRHSNLIRVIFLYLILCFSSVLHSEPFEVVFPGNVELIYYGQEDVPFYSKPLNRVRVGDKILFVIPGVAMPSVHGAWFLENFDIYSGEDVLDLGTGSGLLGIFAAEKAHKVISTDISELAVKNAKLNVAYHGVGNIVEVRQGDLLKPLKKNEKFDVVLFNIDAPHNEETQGLWKLHERFFKNVEKHLKPNGRIYYQSSILTNIPIVQAMVEKNGFKILRLNMVAAVKQDREPFVMRIERDLKKKPGQ